MELGDSLRKLNSQIDSKQAQLRLRIEADQELMGRTTPLALAYSGLLKVAEAGIGIVQFGVDKVL